MALSYRKLSENVQSKILKDRAEGRRNPYRCDDTAAVRRVSGRDEPSLWRPTYVRDTEKIIHLPVYNRYADKTQVFSLYSNDDITRRGLHVQLVSRIARNIGCVLGLNTDLIEAIALGHDIGHTPFGHAGERFLNELLLAETGKSFNHNVHSVRVLDKLYSRNLTLQTLDGILCHNGEFELKEYRPSTCADFERFDKKLEACYTDGKGAIDRLVPSTLEGCVVRICDMIAYLGKDRQDAKTAHLISSTEQFTPCRMGTHNAEIINNLTVDIIENSYGKDHILLSEDGYNDLKNAKDENSRLIYKNPEINAVYEETVRPMFEEMFRKLVCDIKNSNKSSYIYRHHITAVENGARYYGGFTYKEEQPGMIAADYIASMTDDYFVDLFDEMFPHSNRKIRYKSYFSD